jgi:hypothetical protein
MDRLTIGSDTQFAHRHRKGSLLRKNPVERFNATAIQGMKDRLNDWTLFGGRAVERFLLWQPI